MLWKFKVTRGHLSQSNCRNNNINKHAGRQQVCKLLKVSKSQNIINSFVFETVRSLTPQSHKIQGFSLVFVTAQRFTLARITKMYFIKVFGTGRVMNRVIVPKNCELPLFWDYEGRKCSASPKKLRIAIILGL